MGRFTLEQRWEILKIYFQSDCCVAETVRNLKRVFGRNEAPSAPGVRKFIKKVRETGMLVDNKSYPRARPVRTDEIIAAVAQSVRENPSTSIRHRAQELNISRTSLRRILQKILGNSDNEAEIDAYLARVKAEAKEQDAGLDVVDSDESIDEDFNPNQEESDVAEVYDSNHTDSESGEGGEDVAGGSGDEKKKHKEKKAKTKSSKTVSKNLRKRRAGKNKDINRPKRPTTAFMLWLNDMRPKMKAENPGISITEIAKKGGELWKEVTDKSEWDAKATKSKQNYAIAMKEYIAFTGSVKEDNADKKPSEMKKRKEESDASDNEKKIKSSLKRKEESDVDSASENEKKKKKSFSPAKEKDNSGSEEILSTPPSSGVGSDSD